ncbi:sugar ABC transporter ATP-binding protein [Burkholderia ubonensis]|uniref:sugar ABC transporter ATP-binding protein n=1 Tax=Burkholderia ubonensis TaxID=101571 RepID=UPI0018E03AC8|nr:sugar ABC transporter ATP-binding protein [Burkholderia ubonensis]
MNQPDRGYRVSDIRKSYNEVAVLRGVDFMVKPGRIHGLFGHNGAGKSTLMKILAGAETFDSGGMTVDGCPAAFRSPADALSHGIACVYQELRLIPALTVAENLFLGRELVNGGLRNNRQMHAHAQRLLDEYGIKVRASALLRDLSHPDKQMIEVVANLDRNASYLFLDEPTTALSGAQAEVLLARVRQIAVEKEIGVVLVSHKLDEVLGVCDEATVLMGGRASFTDRVGPTTKQRIIDCIVGEEHHVRDVSPSKTSTRDAKTAVSVKDLANQWLRNISLDAKAGEVVGIYGLAGSGRTRFLRALYGLDRIESGRVEVLGNAYRVRNPIDAISRGIAYVTEERKKDGFIPGMTALQNAALSTLSRYSRFGMVQHARAQGSAGELLSRMRIKGDVRNRITGLSGGNQQKVLLARIIQEDASVVLLDEPTKGVDIGAKADIYAIVRQLAGEGKSVIVVSSEEEELLEICDRIYVFRNGTCSENAVAVADASIGALRKAAWA